MADTPIILLTSLGEHGKRPDAGLFAGQLSKPVRREQLLEQVQLALGVTATGCGVRRQRAALRAAGNDLRPLRILLAEDNTVNQKVALAVLKKLGYSADAVANGAEAVAALAAIPYDLVLMDCEMPVMDGFEATARIRALDSSVLNPAVPIVAMTAHALGGDRARCLAAGMNDYISKPVKVPELTALARALGLSWALVSSTTREKRRPQTGSGIPRHWGYSALITSRQTRPRLPSGAAQRRYQAGSISHAHDDTKYPRHRYAVAAYMLRSFGDS